MEGENLYSIFPRVLNKFHIKFGADTFNGVELIEKNVYNRLVTLITGMLGGFEPNNCFPRAPRNIHAKFSGDTLNSLEDLVEQRYIF